MIKLFTNFKYLEAILRISSHDFPNKFPDFFHLLLYSLQFTNFLVLYLPLLVTTNAKCYLITDRLNL